MPTLTRAEAAERSALLTVHSYQVDLDLTTGPDSFRSATTIRFDARAPEAATFAEIRPGELISAELNGRPADLAGFCDGRLPLRGLAASNELIIAAEMPYSHESVGLHRHVDPADGETYLYGLCAPAAAPHIFACFDQPDLKASLSFSVTVPEGWQVLGTGAATMLGPGRWELTATPPLATYLASIVAGPYQSFRAEHDGIPLGLHARRSLADVLAADAKDFFTLIAQCLDEYHRLFGVRYPFGKYDQVFVPEFGVQAMEIPACVLIRDQKLFRGAMSEQDREDRAVIIAHELSHMWFGNLVTMRWWDDLWLNEAFAAYVGHQTPTRVTRFTGAQTSFSAGRKTLGYMADQRPSTHPLSADTPDMATGLANFDHISYFKGSAVIGQLVAMLGEVAFSKGLRTYFERHAYGNADYADFLAALTDGSGIDLAAWGERWLREAGVNTLVPEITVADGRISAAAVVQTAPVSQPVLRPHRFNVGLYGAETAVAQVTIDGSRTDLPELIGRPAPDFLLLNDGDLTYAKIRFDPRSRGNLRGMLPDLAPLNRAMIWSALLLAVRDAAFPAAEYLSLVTDLMVSERELPILTEVLRQARSEVADRFLAPADRPAALDELAKLCRGLLAATEADDERRLVLYRTLIESTADPAELRGWLDQADLSAGIALDAELAWLIRYRLAVLGALSEAEIGFAHDADPSTQTDQAAAKCRAALPDIGTKQQAWQAVIGDTQLSGYTAWALAEGFWQPEQADLTEPYIVRFFTELPAACQLREEQVAAPMAQALFPRYAATPATLDLAATLLSRGTLPVPVGRKVIDCTDDLRRTIAARTA